MSHSIRVKSGHLTRGQIRIVLYEEASRSTPGSPGRFPVSALILDSDPAPPQSFSTGPAGRARRALVVDDEPTIRSAVARYLRRRGW